MKDVRCTLVTTQRELREAYHIRHEIFVKEQKLFLTSDRDACDARAIHIVALLHDEVIGTVRVYEEHSGVWFGSRLAVRKPFRGRVGKLLVQKAIETVQERGAKQFCAYVQLHTASFFKRLGWKPAGDPVDYHGKLHQLMKAQL
jgi:putative N-acetyltransferase (TIGR04045 family)